MKFSNLTLAPVLLLCSFLNNGAYAAETKQEETATPQKEIKIEHLTALIGEWHPLPEGFDEGTKTWMTKNNISDYYVGFGWGTDKGWIDFGDYRVQNDKIRRHGTGIIAYHHGLHDIAFREQGSDSVSVDGTIEIIDEYTFKRHIKAYWPKGLIRNRMDLWAIDKTNPNCMEWSITFYKDGKTYPNPPTHWCKKED